MTRFGFALLLALTLTTRSRAGGSYDQHLPEDLPAEARALITEAISKAYTRLFNDDAVQKCIHENTRLDYVDPKTVTVVHGKPYLDAGRLYKDQIRIARHYLANGTKLPSIVIKMGAEEGFAFAWAQYAKVYMTEPPVGDRIFMHGRFEVTINILKLYKADSDGWAGIIAHEMLHNMMHAHENPDKVGVDKAYAKDILINAAQNCIYNATDYRDYASTYRCGGREPKQ